MKNQFIRYSTGEHSQLGTINQFQQLKYKPGDHKYASERRKQGNSSYFNREKEGHCEHVYKEATSAERAC